MVSPEDLMRQKELTYLELPPDEQKVSQRPKSNIISDKDRVAQSKAPQLDRKELKKILDSARPGRPGPSGAPAPSQQPAAPAPAAADQNPPAQQEAPPPQPDRASADSDGGDSQGHLQHRRHVGGIGDRTGGSGRHVESWRIRRG